MDADEIQESPPIPQSTRTQFSCLSLKPIYILSILVLLLALSFAIVIKTSSFKLHFLKKTLLPHHFLKNNEKPETPYCVLWMAPFLSGGGYSSEAWSYIQALNSYVKKKRNPFFRIGIEHHGDLENLDFWVGLPPEMRHLAIELHQTRCGLDDKTIVVCHSEPGAWHPPLFQTLPCPPTDYRKFKFVIGRTMFETDRLLLEHVKRCNRMDLVWVPTEFHVKTFRQSGVDPMKVRKIVQPVDLDFFDPFKVEPLNLPAIASLVLGEEPIGLIWEDRFVFLSVFKWEYRKGWDVLLRAYLREFSGVDKVTLLLLTNAYHSDSDFGNKIVEYVESSKLERPANGWAPVYVVNGHVAQADLPGLYKASDAFVLPSRGEGWGRPIVEAMAMMIPVITTNWSGQTEYMTDRNSYPLGFEGMSQVKEGPFRGHMWAEPSVDELRVLMRRVMENHDEGRRKGVEARQDMMRRFAPDIVAEEIVKHLKDIVDR